VGSSVHDRRHLLLSHAGRKYVSLLDMAFLAITLIFLIGEYVKCGLCAYYHKFLVTSSDILADAIIF